VCGGEQDLPEDLRCFSHYVAAAFLAITRFKLLFPDWRGYLIGGFALVWVANIYINFFARLRIDLKKERTEIAAVEAAVEPMKAKTFRMAAK
jgi:hypothetical protein